MALLYRLQIDEAREGAAGETEARAANFPKYLFPKPHCQHPTEALNGKGSWFYAALLLGWWGHPDPGDRL